MSVKISDVIFQMQDLSQSFFYQVLVIFIVLDVLTGISKAIIQKRLNSGIGIKGLLTHIFVLIIQTLIGLYCRVLGVVLFSQAMCIFFIGFYGISLFENMYFIGVPLPASFKKYFEQMYTKSIQIPNADIVIRSKQTNSIDIK